jgi:energy-coupling factor transporter ATP-binding protein EcfA2
MALARAEDVRFAYPHASGAALDGVSLDVEPGDVVAVLGPSGSGKSTLLRAFAGLVPWFHGGRFSGRVIVDGKDTRRVRPAQLAGTVATLFQDPEDQVVMTRVQSEVAFGLENLGVAPEAIAPRAAAALEAMGAVHLLGRAVAELSGGELQRVCLASALALEPRLLLLDEPTSQLDPEAAAGLVELAVRLARERQTAVVITEQRPERIAALADRIVFMRDGQIAADAVPAAWLRTARPSNTVLLAEVVCRLENVGFAYRDGFPVLTGSELELRRGEIVALTGPNGSGKTTLAKLAAGLLRPSTGRVVRFGRASYLSQDPGRYLVKERADEEVALGVDGDLSRARRALSSVGLAGYEDRHPRDLSSGERERLALAAVLVTEPDVLILDEPTRGVDPDRKTELAGLLRTAAPVRATLVVTHDRSFAAAVADRTVSLALTPEESPV